jgi:ATP-dependent DNA ligase
MNINPLPSGFIIPAQPVIASTPPSGADRAHEIKHDRYRMIVRRDGPSVRLYSRNVYDWTARLAAIASTAEQIKAKSFTLDGEAVVLLTACRGSRNCPVGRVLEPQSSTPMFLAVARSALG